MCWFLHSRRCTMCVVILSFNDICQHLPFYLSIGSVLYGIESPVTHRVASLQRSPSVKNRTPMCTLQSPATLHVRVGCALCHRLERRSFWTCTQRQRRGSACAQLKDIRCTLHSIWTCLDSSRSRVQLPFLAKYFSSSFFFIFLLHYVNWTKHSVNVHLNSILNISKHRGFKLKLTHRNFKNWPTWYILNK